MGENLQEKNQRSTFASVLGGGTSLVPLSYEVLGTANTGSLFFIPAFNNTLQKQGFYLLFCTTNIVILSLTVVILSLTVKSL